MVQDPFHDSSGEEGDRSMFLDKRPFVPVRLMGRQMGTVPIFAGTDAKRWLTKIGLSPSTPRKRDQSPALREQLRRDSSKNHDVQAGPRYVYNSMATLLLPGRRRADHRGTVPIFAGPSGHRREAVVGNGRLKMGLSP